jgi:hypothetical protein
MIRAAAVLAVGLAVAPQANAQTAGAWLLVICGVGGDAEHRQSFDTRAQTMITAATEQHGLARERVIYLAERPDTVERADAKADAAGIRNAFATLAEQSAAGDAVVVVLLGHGSPQEPGGRFNISGPDMGPADFAELLDSLEGRHVGFVNTTSTSGGFLQLAAPGRVVITATANLREREEPRFGEYFVEAFAGAAADLDKDGRVSLAEAFDYASREVARFYEDEGRMQPEHAMLEDDGDNEASRAPLANAADGKLAAAVTLSGAPVASGAGSDPALQQLRAERAALEAELDDLRERKDSIVEDDYLDQLEDLLVRIAEVDAAIRARESAP